MGARYPAPGGSWSRVSASATAAAGELDGDRIEHGHPGPKGSLARREGRREESGGLVAQGDRQRIVEPGHGRQRAGALEGADEGAEGRRIGGHQVAGRDHQPTPAGPRQGGEHPAERALPRVPVVEKVLAVDGQPDHDHVERPRLPEGAGDPRPHGHPVDHQRGLVGTHAPAGAAGEHGADEGHVAQSGSS